MCCELKLGFGSISQHHLDQLGHPQISWVIQLAHEFPIKIAISCFFCSFLETAWLLRQDAKKQLKELQEQSQVLMLSTAKVVPQIVRTDTRLGAVCRMFSHI